MGVLREDGFRVGNINTNKSGAIVRFSPSSKAMEAIKLYDQKSHEVLTDEMEMLGVSLFFYPPRDEEMEKDMDKSEKRKPENLMKKNKNMNNKSMTMDKKMKDKSMNMKDKNMKMKDK